MSTALSSCTSILSIFTFYIALSLFITCRLTKLVREVLFVSMEDLPILKHWRAALRKDYRAHLLQKDQQSS